MRTSLESFCLAALLSFILGTLAGPAPALAEPAVSNTAPSLEQLIPADKNLPPAWVKSLVERGDRTVYRTGELDFIGMPVGGICAGQLYLGGDGRLWHWDIFNKTGGTGDKHYANPVRPGYPVEQGFAIRLGTGADAQVLRLDRAGFTNISFCGEYPIATVEYRDARSPIAASLEAFSPFIPLNAEDSGLPATVMRFTLRNVGVQTVEGEIGGWLQNAVCLNSGAQGLSERENRALPGKNALLLDCREAKATEAPSSRPDIVFDDFDKETYEGWDVAGTAFGKGPILKSQIPPYQGDVGGPAPRVVNSHATAPGQDIPEKDAQTGTLTSRPFRIERNYITFGIGGGNHPSQTCLNLLVGSNVVRTATGHDSNRMRMDSFDVREFDGKEARLGIVDAVSGAWGNIGIARIAFTDTMANRAREQPDKGTLALALLAPGRDDRALPDVTPDALPRSVFETQTDKASASAVKPVDQKLCGALVRRFRLKPGSETTATFVLTWHFPDLRLKDGGRHYANRFASAVEVATYAADHFDSLREQTRLWRDTWYDSTLPRWFLDRTFANASILASSTCHWFKNGRFYGWEGVGCCEGTCTHVWHYGQAVGRLFPELEREARRRVDFGLAMDPGTGCINHRGEGAGLAVDGQAGCILRVYREHQTSADSEFLKPLWPRVKLAMECLVRMDGGEGILLGAQHNTLDQPWFGKIAWLSSLYVAAARACEEMAGEMGDTEYAAKMRVIVERGSRNIDAQLFNGEYYIQIADPAHARSVGSHDGCEIDQVFGQSWAWQVGLGRILPEAHVKSALAALWKYNFTTNVGPYRAAHPQGRWYAMPGEGGLIMCTWPKGEGRRVAGGFDYYLNECMSGFEYQAAGHMVWEGLVTEGLSVVRAIHDRYHASRRNPWNEVECGDHYARAMASYGVFLAACGYEYHGPKGRLGFAPRLTPEDFRAAFTATEGWGTFAQKREGDTQRETITLKQGRLRVRTLSFALPAAANPGSVKVTVAGKVVASDCTSDGVRLTIALAQDAVIKAGKTIEVRIR